MESFGGEQFLKNPKEAELEKQLQNLTEENRMLDLEKGIDEWHIEHLGKEREEERQEYSVDRLTGADTRKAFEAKLNHAFELIRHGNEIERRGTKSVIEVSLIFIDLDNFKTVNDTLGHTEGDEVLKQASALLRGALRDEDTLGRYGGDEFVVLLLNTNEEDSAAVAGKLRAVLDTDTELHKLGVTGSIGVASSSASGAGSPEALTENADKAMYAAKKGGRNRVEIYHNP